jgi:ribosomal protein S18 acetylase RimI-like enzyme
MLNCSDLSRLKQMFTEIFSEDPKFVDLMFKYKFTDENIFTVRENGIIAAMAYVMYFDCKIGEIHGKCAYIYGVATDEKYRGRGFMSKIFEEIQKSVEAHKSYGALFLYLVPASENLFSMYKKLGFQTGFYLEKQDVDLTGGGSGNLTSGDFHADYLKYIEKIPNVIIRSPLDNELILRECEYKKVNESGFLYYVNNDKLVIREAFIYDKKDLTLFAGISGKNKNLKKAEIFLPSRKENGKPYAMVKIISDEISYGDFQNYGYTNLNFD